MGKKKESKKEAPVKPIEQPIYKFELTEQEANIVMQGLGELPAKVVFNVIGKLQGQFAVQQKNLAEANKKEGKE